MKTRSLTRAVGPESGSAIAALSHVLCWTRMQAESGQGIEDIILRKELERQAGDGFFCWGIGNAPPRSLGTFAREGNPIDVVFSMMKSRPKAIDVTPKGIVVWRSYYDLDGVEQRLPPNVLVTSGSKTSGRSHYALMCHADDGLELTDMGAFDPSAYLNVSEAARPVGASQVTALLRRVSSEVACGGYRINLKASLAKSFWVKLGNPLELASRRRSELEELLQSVRQMSVSDWARLVLAMRGERKSRSRPVGKQLALFDH